ncbi:MAG: polyprenyl synthetase family protein [Gluconacetobacter diazotrophicus]|nr:polyprenyl synthetase family protein [Gluconacetobacter diazotrophicus]
MPDALHPNGIAFPDAGPPPGFFPAGPASELARLPSAAAAGAAPGTVLADARDSARRVEAALSAVLDRAAGPGTPSRLAAALRHAVFPGGARVRPRLCLAVAAACGDPHPALSDAAAAAVELLHCASLVHDDMPCFDDAPLRRGRPSVSALFGADLALLAGDALLVAAFEALAVSGASRPVLLPALLATVARGAGTPHGIVAGQGWECERGPVDLAAYQRGKTGALFAAAATAGAAAAAADPEPWRRLGECLGEAYQVADDFADASGQSAAVLGKLPGRDDLLHRPNAVTELGADGAAARLRALTAAAVSAIPPCANPDALRRLMRHEVDRLLNRSAAVRAA